MIDARRRRGCAVTSREAGTLSGPTPTPLTDAASRWWRGLTLLAASMREHDRPVDARALLVGPEADAVASVAEAPADEGWRVSRFLEAGAMIIGPGLTSFSRPGTLSVADSVRLARRNGIGDGIMLVGRVVS
jgi:hypothetical protein